MADFEINEQGTFTDKLQMSGSSSPFSSKKQN
nr:MAG TPA: hypothetical protein [Caudoviricetes sp.]